MMLIYEIIWIAVGIFLLGYWIYRIVRKRRKPDNTNSE